VAAMLDDPRSQTDPKVSPKSLLHALEQTVKAKVIKCKHHLHFFIENILIFI
jgi:hypothetical protein